MLIFFATKEFKNTKDLLNTGVKTRAKVIKLIKKRSDDGETYSPLFQFTDASNKKITFQSSSSSRPARYRIEDKVGIIYSSTDSNHYKVISFLGLYGWTILGLCLASPLLTIGVGYFLYARG